MKKLNLVIQITVDKDDPNLCGSCKFNKYVEQQAYYCGLFKCPLQTTSVRSIRPLNAIRCVSCIQANEFWNLVTCK